MTAAEERTLPVSFLAAGVCPLFAEKPRQGYRLPTAVLYRGFAPVNSNTAIGLGALMYDFRVRPCYTGKERDAETSLDYFGARYMSSAQGRFTSPDSVTGTPLHIINPQRWNMYAYGLNNPLFYTDPDGRDAIAVGLSQQVRLLGVPVGHAGIISVHSDGTAQYGRSGPAAEGTPLGPNAVSTQPLPKVEFGPGHIPTQDSYRALAEAVAKIEQQDPSTINFAYFKTSEADTLALDSFLSAKQAANDRHGLFWYFGIGNNCADFCINGLSTAHALSSEQAANASVIPNLLFWELSSRADSVSMGATRPKVTEKICDEHGKSCQAVP